LSRAALPDIAPGRRRATSYDVARAAGVAQSTVSRCFKPGAAGISLAVRERVRAAAHRLGYTPNAVARSLILRQSSTAGLIVTEFTLRTNPDLVYAVGSALETAGKRLLLMAVPNDERTAGAVASALEYPLDGLVSGALLEATDTERLQARGIPVLALNRLVPHARVDCVATDVAAAAQELAALLVAAGHRSFACYGSATPGSAGWERADAFAAALRDQGVEAPAPVRTGATYADGRAAFLASARRGGPWPDAVLCANDQLALGVLDACRYDAGLRVPEDVSVVGFDDVAEAGRPAYALTTVRQRFTEMAEAAVTLMAARLANPDAPARRVLVPGDLVRRGSARF
jgi:DNA-binding LacI/PurR family transcriptional regulator